jgi:hypothetical protein
MSEGVPPLRKQIADAKRLGIIVEGVRRTGEVRFLLPSGGPSIRVNHRRTDGTREVAKMLKEVSMNGTSMERCPTCGRTREAGADCRRCGRA